jgi:hypothetical protein
MKFEIYAGLAGGFGGAQHQGWAKFKDDTEAEQYAYNMACEEYEGYAGSSGLRSIEQIMEEDDLEEDSAEEEYNQERESWIDYKVVEVV